MKKVKITASWCTPQEATQRLLEQFKTCEQDADNIEFVYDDSYDIIVGMNYFREELKPGAKAYLFPHEPSWSGSHLRYFGEADLTCFGYRKDLYYPQDKVVELPAHTFYGGRGRWMEGDEWTYERVGGYEGHSKTKNISSVITTLSDKLADTCLYPERSSLVKYLIENGADFVDFYGGWHGGENLKSDHPKKLDAVLDYRFCLSVENEHMENWISEKFYDCILTDTIPIYFGCKNIRDIWGDKGYILIDDLHDHAAILEKLKYINDHAEELYQSMIADVRNIKKLYFYKYNPLKKINQLSRW